MIRGGFHKAIYALRFKFALWAHLFEQIYSNLTSCICALRSIFCIFSQILGALYALRPTPNFYEIHPWHADDRFECWNSLFWLLLFVWSDCWDLRMSWLEPRGRRWRSRPRCRTSSFPLRQILFHFQKSSSDDQQIRLQPRNKQDLF